MATECSQMATTFSTCILESGLDVHKKGEKGSAEAAAAVHTGEG